MILSRIGRSLSRSSRSTFQKSVYYCGNYGVRSTVSSEALSSASGIGRNVDGGGVGSVRSYLSSIGAGKQFVSKTNLSDVNFVAANLGLRRLFSSETPKKKKYENYYPKDKKEVPKGEQKFESKGDSSSGDQQENDEKRIIKLIKHLLFSLFVASSILVILMGAKEAKQVVILNML